MTFRLKIWTLLAGESLQPAHHESGRSVLPKWATWIYVGEASWHLRLYTKIQPYLVPHVAMVQNGWHEGEDCTNPPRWHPLFTGQENPTRMDQSVGTRVTPYPRDDRNYSHYQRGLARRVTYPHAQRDEVGKCPTITEQERLMCQVRQDMECSGDKYWKKMLQNSQFFPTPETSPIHFSYQDGGSMLAVPYHVVGPMAWEYPYHSGQAQEDLPDQLVPASLYGLKVIRPGYLSAFDVPTTLAQATAACNSGRGYMDHISDSDVDKNAHPVGYAGQGYQGRSLFVCPQPECTVAGGTHSSSLLWNSGLPTGTLSMWLLLHCSIA